MVRRMEQVQDVRQREGADIRAEHEVPIPRQRRRARRPDAFQQNRAAAGLEQADRIIGFESEKCPLFSGELDPVQSLPLDHAGVRRSSSGAGRAPFGGIPRSLFVALPYLLERRHSRNS